jgi:hypothetical protein
MALNFRPATTRPLKMNMRPTGFSRPVVNDFSDRPMAARAHLAFRNVLCDFEKEFI